MTNHEFGDTCPLLKIARHFEIDYAVALAVADFYMYGRLIRVPGAMDDLIARDINVDVSLTIEAHVLRFKAMRGERPEIARMWS